jgi:chromosomal replication initiator protein
MQNSDSSNKSEITNVVELKEWKLKLLNEDNNGTNHNGISHASIESSLWNDSISKLQTELDPQIFQAYIKPLKPTKYNSDKSELTVEAPSNFILRHVNDNFKERIASILEDRLGIKGLQIRFAIDNTKTDSSKNNNKVSEVNNSFVVVKKITSNNKVENFPGASFSAQLNPKYTFNSFVVGNSNQFCHAAAMQVADAPGENYNPLFIYGGVGLGKTHLLHAIGNAIKAKNPSAKVLYMSSETFTNELIQSLRYGKMEAFKNKLRSISVLLIDDIQFMCGKDRTQEEFFHTFNALYSAKNQIVLTSDKMPQDIPGIEERLKTRFSWGLTVDMQSPDFETRVAILNKKAMQENFNLKEDVAKYIAENVVSNVRELEGALTRLLAFSSIQKIEITKEIAINALKDLLQPKQINISIDDIKGAVAQQFNIKVSDMVSKRRTRNLSFPRHIAMYLCRKHTTASYPEIGVQFGGRDHSSVIHAANVVTSKISDKSDLVEIIRQIEERLFN